MCFECYFFCLSVFVPWFRFVCVGVSGRFFCVCVFRDRSGGECMVVIRCGCGVGWVGVS